MQLSSRRAPGFTIIELLVVIIILCILAGLVALTASGVQAKNRNGERQSEIDTLRGQLESHYAQTNTYPTFDNLHDAEWRTKNMPRLKAGVIEDPRWSNGVTACSTNNKATTASQPTANCYSYQVISSDGSLCDNIGTPCAHYTLTASLEGGENYVKSSLN